MAKKGSVLICDDEEIMRDVLGTILSGAGYKVELAKTGEEAVDALCRAGVRRCSDGRFDARNGRADRARRDNAP